MKGKKGNKKTRRTVFNQMGKGLVMENCSSWASGRKGGGGRNKNARLSRVEKKKKSGCNNWM